MALVKNVDRSTQNTYDLKIGCYRKQKGECPRQTPLWSLKLSDANLSEKDANLEMKSDLCLWSQPQKIGVFWLRPAWAT